MTMPQLLADAPADAAPVEPPRRVLVIDDSLTVRLFCAHLLVQEGFAVTEATNGLDGLERALDTGFDLFVVDINMPTMDGYAFLTEVRRQPGLCAIPALVLSTEQGTEDIAGAYRAGANFYLSKPIVPDRFLATVKLMTGVPCR